MPPQWRCWEGGRPGRWAAEGQGLPGAPTHLHCVCVTRQHRGSKGGVAGDAAMHSLLEADKATVLAHQALVGNCGQAARAVRYHAAGTTMKHVSSYLPLPAPCRCWAADGSRQRAEIDPLQLDRGSAQRATKGRLASEVSHAASARVRNRLFLCFVMLVFSARPAHALRRAQTQRRATHGQARSMRSMEPMAKGAGLMKPAKSMVR